MFKEMVAGGIHAVWSLARKLVHNQRLIIPMLALLVCLGAVSVGHAAPVATGQTGVVDYQYLVDHHPDAAKALAALRAEEASAQKQFKAKAPSLNEKQRQELEQKLSGGILQKRQALLKPITTSVDAAIKAVADSKGLAIVLEKRAVAFGGTDITKDVLKKLGGK